MNNPYKPPSAELKDSSESRRPIALIVPISALCLLGTTAFASSVVGLAASTSQGLPFWFFYVALSPSLLLLLGAYMLWRRSAWAIALLVAAVVVRSLPYFVMVPTNEPSLATTAFGRAMEYLPPRIALEGLMILAIALYCLFLRKWNVLN